MWPKPSVGRSKVSPASPAVRTMPLLYGKGNALTKVIEFMPGEIVPESGAFARPRTRAN
jgi:hypothetical protein